MTVLSDSDIKRIREECEFHFNHDSVAMGRAIEAAILAKLQGQEPVAWMLECQNPGNGTSWRLSWSRSGAGVCNRLPGEASERPLYEHATPPALPVAVPDGWKLVPVVADSEMEAAIQFATSAFADPQHVWSDALLAAPCAPIGESMP